VTTPLLFEKRRLASADAAAHYIGTDTELDPKDAPVPRMELIDAARRADGDPELRSAAEHA